MLTVLLTQISANEPGKVECDGQSTQAPSIHVGAMDGNLGSWLLPDLPVVIVAIGGVNQ